MLSVCRGRFLKQPEQRYFVDLVHLSLVEFFHDPGALDWTNAIRLADKMGMLKRGTVGSSEPTDAQVEDADLLALGDAAKQAILLNWTRFDTFVVRLRYPCEHAFLEQEEWAKVLLILNTTHCGY